MQQPIFALNSLVAYKKEPAKLVAQNNKKFKLLLTNNNSINVRAKDFVFIHPEYKIISAKQPSAVLNIDVLKDLSEEELDIRDICLWLFDKYTANNAWQVYKLTIDRIYCYQKGNKFVIRPYEQVQKIIAEKTAKELQEQQILAFIRRLKNNELLAKDDTHLQDVASVAVNDKKYSKILAQMGLENNSRSAHKLLLNSGYYSKDFNPYPQRYNYPLVENVPLDLVDNALQRKDLRHLNCYAIDNKNSNDADDAISIDGNTIWVHIADVSAFILANSPLDDYAKKRASSIYLPEQVIHMLPNTIISSLALGTSDTSKALSISFNIGDDNQISNINVFHSLIKVVELNYEFVSKNINAYYELQLLQQIANKHKLWRQGNGSIQLTLPKAQPKYQNNKVFFYQEQALDIRSLVAEIMIISGRVIALFAIKNQIPVPFLTQEPSDFSKQEIANQAQISLANKFAIIAKFKRSKVNVKPSIHSSMGLDSYTRITSPIRRYFDLLAHQQLHCYISNKPLLTPDEIKNTIKQVNKTIPVVNKITRDSNKHFQCLYFIQNPNWSGKAVVINQHKDMAILCIEELAIITKCKSNQTLIKDSLLNIKLKNVDIVNLDINFIINT